MSLSGEKSARVGSCARGALPGAAATGKLRGHVARRTWQKMFASSNMKWSQSGLLSSLPLAFCEEVKSLSGYSRTPLVWNGRNYMFRINP